MSDALPFRRTQQEPAEPDPVREEWGVKDAERVKREMWKLLDRAIPQRPQQ